MKKRTRIISVLLIVVGIGYLIWLTQFKSDDFVAVFSAKTLPAIVNQSLKTWNRSLEEAEISQSQDQRILFQKVRYGDSTFAYTWTLEPVHDSLSEVRVGVSLLEDGMTGNSMLRLKNLFVNTDFKKRSKASVIDFNDKLKEHISSYRVSLKGIDSIGSAYCAFVPIQSDQLGKARGMMKNYMLLSGFLIENEIEPAGHPFVEITRWDQKEDMIEYHFCYPVVYSDSLPKSDLVSFKQFAGKKALKAIFNGNYISSDRAWYHLIDQASRKDLEVSNLPIEVFYDNPNMGGDALKWKAEVFMPLK